MSIRIDSIKKKHFTTMELEISQDGKIQKPDFKRPYRDKKEGLQKKPFSFKLSRDDGRYVGKGSFGYEALWLPLSEETGIKIIRGLDDIAQIEKNVKYINSIDSDIFPSIHWFERAIINENECLIIEMENIRSIEEELFSEAENYLHSDDKRYISSKVNVPVRHIDRCIREFKKHQLMPEFTWEKNGGFSTVNVIGGKIVDFHTFKYMKERYLFPTNGASTKDTEEIYKRALQRYRKWIDLSSERIPKWKGTIYQGMEFDNDFVMNGYSSDGKIFDSNLKIHFMPLDRIKGGKVLEIGSNQGYFCTQAALHGAKKVLGVELTEEDVMTASEIRDELTKLENIEYIAADAKETIVGNGEWYDLIILSSVFHQLYPDMHTNRADNFLSDMASRCQYLFFETPIRHKHFNVALEEMAKKLEKHFEKVRLSYVYDAYSTGYRAIFICSPMDPLYNDRGIWKGRK